MINPINPKIINNIPDIFCIVVSDIYLFNNLPKIIASESLTTMPRIAPSINNILELGYSIPKPTEARKVLSPNSPTIIDKAIIKE